MGKRSADVSASAERFTGLSLLSYNNTSGLSSAMWDYRWSTLVLPDPSQTHSHHTQRSGVSTRTWPCEETRLVPASVSITLTLRGSVCLSSPWAVPWSQSPPQRDVASCWAPLPLDCCPTSSQTPKIHPNPSHSPFPCLSPHILRGHRGNVVSSHKENVAVCFSSKGSTGH